MYPAAPRGPFMRNSDLKPGNQERQRVLRASAQQPTHAHTQHGSQLFFFFKRKTVWFFILGLKH